MAHKRQSPPIQFDAIAYLSEVRGLVGESGNQYDERLVVENFLALTPCARGLFDRSKRD